MSKFKLKLYFEEQPIIKSNFDKLDNIKPIINKLKKKFGE